MKKYTVTCTIQVDKPAGKADRTRQAGETALESEFEAGQLTYLLKVGALVEQAEAKKEGA